MEKEHNIEQKYIPKLLNSILDENNGLKNDRLLLPFIKVGSKKEFNVYLKGKEDFTFSIVVLGIFTFLGLPFMIKVMIDYIIRIIDGKYVTNFDIVLDGLIYGITLVVLLGAIFSFFKTSFISREQSYILYLILISKSKILDKTDVKISQNGDYINFSSESKDYYLEHPENPLHCNFMYIEDDLILENLKQYKIEIDSTEIDFIFKLWHPEKRWRRSHYNQIIVEINK